MIRSLAVKRINRGLGYRPDGWSGEGNVILCLQEAQNDLEKGKTLPRFLLQEDQTLSLVSGTHTVLYPSGFLRENDDTRIRFYPTNTANPFFLTRRLYIDAVQANLPGSTDVITITTKPTFPKVYVMRQGFIDFITTANTNYTLTWDYYKAGVVLTSDIENAWLADGAGAQWLIGEAGYRMAMDLRDETAKAVFGELRTMGRAACFGEQIAAEEASGPYVMGANQ